MSRARSRKRRALWPLRARRAATCARAAWRRASSGAWRASASASRRRRAVNLPELPIRIECIGPRQSSSPRTARRTRRRATTRARPHCPSSCRAPAARTRTPAGRRPGARTPWPEHASGHWIAPHAAAPPPLQLHVAPVAVRSHSPRIRPPHSSPSVSIGQSARSHAAPVHPAGQEHTAVAAPLSSRHVPRPAHCFPRRRGRLRARVAHPAVVAVATGVKAAPAHAEAAAPERPRRRRGCPGPSTLGCRRGGELLARGSSHASPVPQHAPQRCAPPSACRTCRGPRTRARHTWGRRRIARILPAGDAHARARPGRPGGAVRGHTAARTPASRVAEPLARAPAGAKHALAVAKALGAGHVRRALRQLGEARRHHVARARRHRRHAARRRLLAQVELVRRRRAAGDGDRVCATAGRPPCRRRSP